jgi:hypothetical protein
VSPLRSFAAWTDADVSVLREEFPDVERHPILLAFRTSEFDVSEARECFSTRKLLGGPGADVNQFGNRTSTVDGFRDLLSASTSPTVPVEGRAMILLLFEDRRSRLSHRRVPIRVVAFAAIPPPWIQTIASRFTSSLPVRPVTSRFKLRSGHPPSVGGFWSHHPIPCPSLEPRFNCAVIIEP